MIVRIKPGKPDASASFVAVLCDDDGTECIQLACPPSNLAHGDTFDIRLPGVDMRQLITLS